MKNFLLSACFVCLSAGFFSVLAQKYEIQKVQIIKSERPADGRPYSFPSVEARDEHVPVKIKEFEELIRLNSNDAERVKVYREIIWRFENAIIANTTGSEL